MMIICVIMTDDSNVIVIFTCHRQHCRQHECGLDNLPVSIIAQTITTISHCTSLTLFFELITAPLSRSNLATSVSPFIAA